MPLPRYLMLLAGVILAAFVTISLAAASGVLAGPALPIIAVALVALALGARFFRK